MMMMRPRKKSGPPETKTPAAGATATGAKRLGLVEQGKKYAETAATAIPSRTWTISADLFVVAFAAADRVTA